MEKQNIRSIIIKFFENNFSKDLILRFQFWFTQTGQQDIKEDILNELWESETAGVNELTLYGLKEINRRIGKKPASGSLYRRILQIAALFLLPLAGSFLTYWVMDQNDYQPVQVAEMVEYNVPDGDMKYIVLPDGTQVWLNAGSVLLHSGEMSGPERILFLTGEASFQVKKDSVRPFIVKTQYMQIEALGTTFNVKSYNDAGTKEVTLEEGSVRVEVNGKITASELMYPNEQMVYDHRLTKVSKYPVDAGLVARWKEGYLVFQDASFEEVIRTIERRFKVSVNYDIRKYGGGNFSIKYMPYENVQQILDVFSGLNPGMEWTIENEIITIK